MSDQIIYERVKNTLYLRLPPEIDHHSSKEIRERTEEYLREGGVRHMVFDFSRTTFMDSSGVGALLGRYKRMREKGGTVAICGVDDRVKRILHISGIDRLIPQTLDGIEREEHTESGTGRRKGDKHGKDEF